MSSGRSAHSGGVFGVCPAGDAQESVADGCARIDADRGDGEVGEYSDNRRVDSDDGWAASDAASLHAAGKNLAALLARIGLTLPAQSPPRITALATVGQSA